MYFATRKNQPLIGIPLHENGEEIICYFSDEAEAEAISSLHSIDDILALAGVWQDLDWDEMEKELARIRQTSSKRIED